MLLIHWVVEACDVLQFKYKDAITSSFRSGLGLNLDEAEDSMIQIKGVEEMKVGEWRGAGAESLSQDTEAANAAAEIWEESRKKKRRTTSKRAEHLVVREEETEEVEEEDEEEEGEDEGAGSERELGIAIAHKSRSDRQAQERNSQYSEDAPFRYDEPEILESGSRRGAAPRAPPPNGETPTWPSNIQQKERLPKLDLALDAHHIHYKILYKT